MLRGSLSDSARTLYHEQPGGMEGRLGLIHITCRPALCRCAALQGPSPGPLRPPLERFGHNQSLPSGLPARSLP